jgi:hypothetical protein
MFLLPQYLLGNWDVLRIRYLPPPVFYIEHRTSDIDTNDPIHKTDKRSVTMSNSIVCSPEVTAFVTMAEKNHRKFLREKAEGKLPTKTLSEIINNPAMDVVVGIYPDEAQPARMGVRVIKGEKKFPGVFSGVKVTVDAVFCRCPVEAEVMRRVFGDDRDELH